MAVLNTANHIAKAELTSEAAHFYAQGVLPLQLIAEAGSDAAASFPVPPERPARPDHLQIVEPRLMPGAKKGVENHQWNKMRLIHSLAHIGQIHTCCEETEKRRAPIGPRLTLLRSVCWYGCVQSRTPSI